MANYKQGKVTQGIFDAVKICLESGNSIEQTAKFMKLSWDVVAMIRDAETLMDYKAAMYAKYENRRKKNAAIKAAQEKKTEQETKPEPVKPVMNPTVIKVEATHYMMTELQKTNELLTAISAKLAFIVDELCGVKPNAEQDH